MSASRPPSSKHGPRISRVAEAVQRVPRGLFVGHDSQRGQEHRGEAQPEALSAELVTRMLESLELEGNEKALLVGASSAYEAALLSQLVLEVYAVEPDAARMNEQQRVLQQFGCRNVKLVSAEPRAGWPKAAPYQVIMLAAALPSLPMRLIDQLDAGGRLVVALGDKESQLMTRLRRHPDSLECDTLCACSLAMLAGSRRVSQFPWNDLGTGSPSHSIAERPGRGSTKGAKG
jgi:protein-L-isoaspartate(D-aspartate) O-methyltransferase